MAFLGYTFKDETLLERALVTPAYKMDHPSAQDNQRLEFLGDAVLGFLSAECLFGAFGDEQEGALTVRRTHMVSTAALCAAAERIGLAARLKRNRHAEALPRNAKTLADAIEAIMGAAYLDGGFEAAKTVFAGLGLATNADKTEWIENPKGELQVRAQAMKPPRHPEYHLVNTTGKAHEPVFTVKVTVDGMGAASASASSLKEAESHAAAQLLENLRKA